VSTQATILVVDDELPLREFVRKNLEARGFAVRLAADGQEALAAFGRGGVDLIVLDLMLPVLDGLAVARAVRAGSAVPILALTALADPEHEAAARAAGVDDYLTKPFSVEALLGRVRSLLKLGNRV
jgi:DNA-binding response OmpR family regulator